MTICTLAGLFGYFEAAEMKLVHSAFDVIPVGTRRPWLTDSGSMSPFWFVYMSCGCGVPLVRSYDNADAFPNVNIAKRWQQY